MWSALCWGLKVSTENVMGDLWCVTESLLTYRAPEATGPRSEGVLRWGPLSASILCIPASDAVPVNRHDGVHPCNAFE